MNLVASSAWRASVFKLRRVDIIDICRVDKSIASRIGPSRQPNGKRAYLFNFLFLADDQVRSTAVRLVIITRFPIYRVQSRSLLSPNRYNRVHFVSIYRLPCTLLHPHI